MKKSLAALAALAVLFGLACGSGGPTAPTPPGPTVQPPTILVFTAEPATVTAGAEVAINFQVRFRERAQLTILLYAVGDPSPLFHLVRGEDRPGVTWTTDNRAIGSTRHFPTVTTTYRLTASDDAGSVEQSRTVTVQ